MKNRNLVWGMIALLVLALVLTGCSGGSGSPPSRRDPQGSLLSGTFGGKTFSVNEVGTASGDTKSVEGLLKDGGNLYDLKGFFNTVSGNFTLSTASDEAGFELSGKYAGGMRSARAVGNREGRGKSKQKAGGEWTVSEDSVSFSNQNVTGNPNVTAATPLPEAWWGTYDFSLLADSDNSAGVEAWMSGNGGDQRSLFVMVLGPYSMDFWANLDLMRPYFEDELDMTEEEADDALALYATVQSSFTVLEVSGSGTTYEVLLLLSLFEDSPYYDLFEAEGNDDLVTETAKFGMNVREGYRKVQLVRAANGKVTATLAGDFPMVYKTAAQANAATYAPSERTTQLIFEPWELQ